MFGSLETTEQKASYLRDYKILEVYYKEDDDGFFIEDEIERIEEVTVSDALSGIGYDIYSGDEVLDETELKKDSNGKEIKKDLFYRVDVTGDEREDMTDCYGSFEQVLGYIEDCELLSDFEEIYRVVDFTQFEIDTNNRIKKVFGNNHRCNSEIEIWHLKSKISSQSNTFILEAWAMYEKIRNFMKYSGNHSFKFVEKNEIILSEWKEVGQMLLAIRYLDSDSEEREKKELFNQYGYDDEIDYINERVIRYIHSILNYDKIYWRESIND